MSSSQSSFAVTAIDFEGTGKVKGYPDEPWQIGLVQIRDGLVDGDSCYESYLRVQPGRPFNPYAPGRHAEIRQTLAQAPILSDLWGQLRPRFENSCFVAHNAATETRYLNKAFPLHPPGPWLDTLKLARIAYPKLHSYKLEDLLPQLQLVAKVECLVPGREPHDALYDAVGCACLFAHLLALPGWQNTTPEALLSLQARKR